jgi:hypothetical protein
MLRELAKGPVKDKPKHLYGADMEYLLEYRPPHPIERESLSATVFSWKSSILWRLWFVESLRLAI